jgi:undecaprenyl phosphate-alpha-L-ara4N flippase subunit ArnE
MLALAWLSLATVVALGTVGQLALKFALRRPATDQTLARSLVNLPMLIWLACYIATTLLWLFALREIPLSQAFPILGLQFALIPLASSKLLEETVTIAQWLGVAIIIAGVALVTQS